ncbi:MAG: DNA gyrase subunit A [Clostridiales bacterium]|nr:DNA gyrase subunit A [Clostridiales bacterium]
MAHNRDYKPEDIMFPDQVITESNIVAEMKKAMLDYSMSVIVDRALPDVRDGLKPVHRRILYTLYEDGMTSDKPFKKAAACVGDVLGKYHPHGDASVYDAMVRLAQDFSMRYMLVDGHGNFGSVDGDPPAAYRYTEARLSKISNKLLEDIDKDTVDWNPNFDESRKEPKVLPSKFPNLLVNGSQGIAVGMTTSIPPHNLKEVVGACVCVLDNPDATLDMLMEHIKGPDFPTKGIIMGRAGIRAAYATGRGKVVVRAKANFEEYGRESRTRIIVTELPYTVKKRALIKSIADQVKEKRLEGISDLRDETDKKGMRIVIELKRDANPNVVLNRLFAQTAMQSTFSIIMRALVDDQKQPKILSLKEVIDEYLFFQKQVIRRRINFDLKKMLARAHIIEGLFTAQSNIDEVIHIIRTSYDDAGERLMSRFGLDEIQTQAILDMRLKALQGLDKEKLESEYRDLEEKIANLRSILADENKINGVLKDELISIAEKFGDERRTEIQNVSGEVDVEDLIPVTDCVFALTERGFIKRTPVAEYKLQGRGGKGVKGITQRDEDNIKTMFTCSSHDNIMFFTSLGRVYSIKGYMVPESSRTAKGTSVVNMLSLMPGEKVSVMLKVPVFDSGEYFIDMVTKKGVIKRCSLDMFKKIRQTGIIAISLDEGDELALAAIDSNDNTIIVASKFGKCVCFSTDQARAIGRSGRGMRAMKLAEGDEVVGLDIIDESKYILTISENGFGRLSPVTDFPVHSRGGKGLINYHTEKYGNVIFTGLVNQDDNIMLISLNGMVVKVSLCGVTPHSRPSKGVILMRLNEGDRLISAVSLSKDEEDDDVVSVENSGQDSEDSENTLSDQATQTPEE